MSCIMYWKTSVLGRLIHNIRILNLLHSSLITVKHVLKPREF